MENNPFRMAGSYTGAILYPLISVLLFFISPIASAYFLFPVVLLTRLIIPTGLGIEGIGRGFLLALVLGSAFGFLIGWGIHVLWRICGYEGGETICSHGTLMN